MKFVFLIIFFISFKVFTQNEVKRNPDLRLRKDYVNVFYNPAYTLFDFWSDEPIFPNADGIYTIYTATNEVKIPRLLTGTSTEVVSSITYKFKNYSNCKNWCEGKIYVQEIAVNNEGSSVAKNDIIEQDFGISKINFIEIGNPNYKRLTDAEILESKFRQSLCYTVGNYLNKSLFYDSLLGKSNVMNKLAELLAPKLGIEGNKEVSPLFFMALKRIGPHLTMEDMKGKTAKDQIIYFAYWYRNNYKVFEVFGCKTPDIQVQAHYFDFQEKDRLEEIKRKEKLNNGDYENGARNYCISTTANKYILSLFDDGSKKVIYKLYDKNGNLTKTIQGVWVIKDEGVYGAAYFLYISWSGLNSNMPNLKYTCQYDAKRVLQSIIDSQGRTWFECK